LAPKGQSDRGQDQDDTIFVPLTTAQKKIFGTPFVGMVRVITVKAKGADQLAAAEGQIIMPLCRMIQAGFIDSRFKCGFWKGNFSCKWG